MKRIFYVTAMGISICLTTSAMRGDDGTQSGRMVCDETCKLGSAEPAGSGKAAKPTARAPGFSVVSPVGRIVFVKFCKLKKVQYF